MKVLGLDLSLLATGVCVVEDGCAGDRWLLRTNSDVIDMERYEYIASRVIGLLFTDGPLSSGSSFDLVAMEGVYASRNLLTYGRLVALSTVVQYALHRSKMPYVVLTPSAWRTAVFGPKSKIDKEKVRAATAMRLREWTGTMDVGSIDLNVLEAFLVGLAAWKVQTGQVAAPAKRAKRATKPKVEE